MAVRSLNGEQYRFVRLIASAVYHERKSQLSLFRDKLAVTILQQGHDICHDPFQ